MRATKLFEVILLASLIFHATGGATRVAAQPLDQAGSVDLPLAEPTRVFVNAPNAKTNDHFEALLALHFPASERLRSARSAAESSKRTVVAWIPSASMLINLRQLREDSAPVRSPSYMPRIRLTAVAVVPPVEGQSDTQWMADATIGHYSNGQANCLFVQQILPDGSCGPLPSQTGLVVNSGGSFSSHYAELGAALRKVVWGHRAADGLVRARQTGTVFLRFRDYRLLSGVPGGMNSDLRHQYGSWRLRFGSELFFDRRMPGPLWFAQWVEWGPRIAGGSVAAIRGAVEIGMGINSLRGAGLFVRHYTGHDDYNANFLTHVSVLQAGLTIGGERRQAR